MNILRRDEIAGIVLIELEELDWWQIAWDTGTQTMICGELEQAQYMLWRTAWVERCYRDLDVQLEDLARRVGVEYTPSRNRKPTATAGE